MQSPSSSEYSGHSLGRIAAAHMDEFNEVCARCASEYSGHSLGRIAAAHMDEFNEVCARCARHEDSSASRGSLASLERPVLSPLTSDAACFFYLCVHYMWGVGALDFPESVWVREDVVEMRAQEAALTLFGTATQPECAAEWREVLMGAFWSSREGVVQPLLHGNPWCSALLAVLVLSLYIACPYDTGRVSALQLNALVAQTLAARHLPYGQRALYLTPESRRILARACVALELVAAGATSRYEA